MEILQTIFHVFSLLVMFGGILLLCYMGGVFGFPAREVKTSFLIPFAFEAEDVFKCSLLPEVFNYEKWKVPHYDFRDEQVFPLSIELMYNQLIEEHSKNPLQDGLAIRREVTYCRESPTIGQMKELNEFALSLAPLHEDYAFSSNVIIVRGHYEPKYKNTFYSYHKIVLEIRISTIIRDRSLVKTT